MSGLNNLRIFEKCCGMKAEFVKGAQSLLQNIAQFDSIEDLGELQKVIESDSVVAKRLTKLNQSFERVQSFFNRRKVENLVNDDAFKDKFRISNTIMVNYNLRKEIDMHLLH